MKLYFLALIALIGFAQARNYRSDLDIVYNRAYNAAYKYTCSRSTAKKVARKMVKKYRQSNRTVNHFIHRGFQNKVYKYCDQIRPIAYYPMCQTDYYYRPIHNVGWSPYFYEPCYVIKRNPSVGFSFGNRKFGFGFNLPL